MASVPTTAWNESSPAGSDNVSSGDDRIREMKTQIREVIDVDHDFPSSGNAADNGQHKKVTLQEQANLGTGAVNATILGSQTVNGKGELVYTTEDDADIQLTSDGKLGAVGVDALCKDLVAINIKIDSNNTYIKAKDAAGTGTVDLIKANASDVAVIPDGSQMATSGAPTVDAGIANKKYVDDNTAIGAVAAKNDNTVYQATTNGFFIGMITATNATYANNWTAQLIGYTDASNPPTTVMGYAGIGSREESTGAGRTQSNSFCIPVKSGEYYKGVASGGNYTASYKFIPLGA